MEPEAGPSPRRTTNPGVPFEAVPLDDPSCAARVTAEDRRRAGRFAEEGERLARDGDRESIALAIDCLDLTSLGPDDTEEHIAELCRRAREPVPDTPRSVAAVCVLPRFVRIARQALVGSGVAVAVACGDFPTASAPLRERTEEIEYAVDSGADEVDVPIDRSLVHTEDWRGLYEQIRRCRLSAGETTLKIIVSAAELGGLRSVERVALVALAAGADFLKTSTGKGDDRAEPIHGLAIAAALRRYREETGRHVGLKAAGGLRTAADACSWIALARTELGEDALDPGRFRLGASGLLDALADALPPTNHRPSDR